METKLSKKVITILNENERKHGACYGDRKMNKEGIIFDSSNNGYHFRVSNVDKQNG